MKRVGFFVVAAGVLTIACSTSDGLEKRPATFVSISAAGTRLIAGGKDGKIYASNDSGASWAAFIHVSSQPIEAAYRAPNESIEIVVGGRFYTRATTNRGWASYFAPAETLLHGVGPCRDATFVVGSGGFGARSVDGNNWTYIKGVSNAADLIDLACGRTNLLIASFSQGHGHWLSTDGTTFTNVTSPADTCSVAHAGNLFYNLAVDGRVFTSPDDDAKTWTEIARIPWPKPVNFCTLIHAANMFCVSGADLVTCSADGTTWTEVARPSKCPVSDIALEDDGKLFGVCNDGTLLDTKCSNGACEPAKITRIEAIDLTTGPKFGPGGSSGGTSGGTSGSTGGTCDQSCTQDSDCTALAKRNGVAGAVCSQGLCYPCLQLCSSGTGVCECIPCSRGCGTDATCPTGTNCAFVRDGKKPCE
jgi:hypothetical protein